MKCSKCHREIVETGDAAYGLDGSVYHNECPFGFRQKTPVMYVTMRLFEDELHEFFYDELNRLMAENHHEYMLNEFPPSQSPKRAEPK